MKKYLAILMSLMMVSSIVVGCGSGSSSSSSGSDAKAVTEAPAEDTSKKDESVKAESKVEEVAESQAAESQSNENEGFNSYDEIYEEYSQKIKDATDGLIEEYKAEAAENEGGLEGLADISNAKISKLAEIQTEGTEAMATFMATHGSGKYDEYEEWAGKLYEVYEEEAGKITDAYMASATE